MRGILEDLRFSFRLLRKSPAFAFLATACLALGVGANASIFSLLNALVLRGLPVPDANRLVLLRRGDRSTFSYPDYKDLRARSKSVRDMVATIPTESSLDRAGQQGQLVTAEAVSANYGRLFEMGTVIGSWFDSEEAPVAVISYRVWQSVFRGNPNVLGERVRSESQWYTIVGVAPPGFTGVSSPMTTSIWVPLRVWTNQHPAIRAEVENRDRPLVMIFGRLAPGVQESAATAEIHSIGAALRRETVRPIDPNSPISVRQVRGISAAGNRRNVKTIMTLLFTVVGLLLMICCINVGNLLLVRGATRRQEVAIRYALGASRKRIMRQLLADSFLLACAGGLGGFAVAASLVRLMIRLLPSLPFGESISSEIPMDLHVIVFTGGSAAATILLFGLFPALRISATHPYSGVRQESRGFRGVRLRRMSVAAQIALSFLLLTVAGLFLHTFWLLRRAEPGFAVRNRLYAITYISAPEFKPNQIAPFYSQVLQDLRAIPGVQSAALTYLLPLDPAQTECAAANNGNRTEVSTSTISPDFLSTMEIPLLRGRDFSSADRESTTGVVLVNAVLADRLWPHISALGQQIKLGCQQPRIAIVVGITANSATVSIAQPLQPHIYLPFAQNATGLANIVVEASAPLGPMLRVVRQHLFKEGRGLRVYAIERLSDHVQRSFWQLRWETSLIGAFGITALILAALGLYGLISYSTALRTQEFGVRMALGAQPADVMRLVLKEGMTLALAGIGVGLIASLSATPFLAAILFGVKSIASGVYVAVAAGWLAIVLVASYLPAYRAARLEPSVTLRHE